jgi:hypothetical protein
MPNYIQQALHNFEHNTPTQQQHAPYPWRAPTSGTKIQLTPPPDNTPLIDKKKIMRTQKLLGTLIYWGRAVNPTIIPAISELASEQATSTETTVEKLTQLLNYCATNPNATIQYAASDMVLHIHPDVSYLLEPKSPSRIGGHFFLNSATNSTNHIHNGPILAISTVYKNVLSSIMESSVAGTFVNAKEGVNVRNILNTIGHPQLKTALFTNNLTTFGIVSEKMKQQRPKVIDMCSYWLKDREAQNQFIMFWAPGKLNLGDYYTKHHAPTHNQNIKRVYLHDNQNSCMHLPQELSTALQRCVKTA